MRPASICAGLVSVFLLMAASTEAAGPGSSVGLSSNDAPRLASVTARIASVYDESRARLRSGGLALRFRLCDDGPPSSDRSFGLMRLEHRWGDGSHTWLFVREQAPLITWDIHFDKPECVSAIPWSSTLPADLSYAGMYACYTVRVRVRDPGGRWSNARSVKVKKCKS